MTLYKYFDADGWGGGMGIVYVQAQLSRDGSNPGGFPPTIASKSGRIPLGFSTDTHVLSVAVAYGRMDAGFTVEGIWESPIHISYPPRILTVDALHKFPIVAYHTSV